MRVHFGKARHAVKAEAAAFQRQQTDGARYVFTLGAHGLYAVVEFKQRFFHVQEEQAAARVMLCWCATVRKYLSYSSSMTAPLFGIVYHTFE